MEEERMTGDGPSLKRVVSDLVQEVGTLVRQEMNLAKCEIAEKAERAKGGATRFGLGSALAIVSAFVLALALVLGLSLVLDNWMSRPTASFLSALIVGIGLGAAGYFLIRSGVVSLNPAHWVPRRTVESIKEDARWARKRV
jgi:hypothetical protein